jgi:hypothetical protein
VTLLQWVNGLYEAQGFETRATLAALSGGIASPELDELTLTITQILQA